MSTEVPNLSLNHTKELDFWQEVGHDLRDGWLRASQKEHFTTKLHPGRGKADSTKRQCEDFYCREYFEGEEGVWQNSRWNWYVL